MQHLSALPHCCSQHVLSCPWFSPASMGSPKRNSAQASKGTALLTVPVLCCLLFRSVVGFKFKQGTTGSSSSTAVDGVQPVPHFRWGKHYQEVMGLSDLPLHIAGAILPVIVANPLQVVKVQLQSSKAPPGRSAIALAHAIFERDGIKGFFRGLLPALVGICPAIFSHGLVYFMLKKLVTGGAWSGERHGDLTELLCGLAAIFAQNIVTNPIGMVQTRMQLGSDPADGGSAGWREVARSILAGEGPRGFYKGLLASCLRCSENLIVFTARGHVDRWLKNRVIPPPAAKDRSLRWNMFKIFEGPIPRSHSVVPYTLIKLAAILATYPFEVVRTRQREQAQKGVSNKYNGLLQSLSLLTRDEGLGGLYAGAGTHLARVVAGSSLLACLEWYGRDAFFAIFDINEWSCCTPWLPKPLACVVTGLSIVASIVSKVVALSMFVNVSLLPELRPGPSAWPL